MSGVVVISIVDGIDNVPLVALQGMGRNVCTSKCRVMIFAAASTITTWMIWFESSLLSLWTKNDCTLTMGNVPHRRHSWPKSTWMTLGGSVRGSGNDTAPEVVVVVVVVVVVLVVVPVPSSSSSFFFSTWGVTIRYKRDIAMIRSVMGDVAITTVAAAAAEIEPSVPWLVLLSLIIWASFISTIISERLDIPYAWLVVSYCILAHCCDASSTPSILSTRIILANFLLRMVQSMSLTM